MRTKTIARWRRAALGGLLSASLAAPAARAQDPVARARAAAPADADAKAAAADDAKTAAPADDAKAPAPAEAAAPDAEAKAPVRRIAAPEGGATPAAPEPPSTLSVAPGTPDEYTIQKGDTLWDLSQKFLNNPWYWPKIWSLNPAIENPHWIYPGNRLKIVPGEGGAQAPAQVQAEGEAAPAGQAGQAEQAAEGETRPPVGSADFEVVKKNSRESIASNNSVSVSGKLGFTPPPYVMVRATGLVTPDEMQNAGSLAASFEEKEMLTTYDTAYVRYKGEAPVKPGDKVLLFRPDGDVVHPLTHQKIASQTKTVATAKVLTVRGDLATVSIGQVWEEIGRGDMVRPWSPQEKRVAPRPNKTEVSGVLVAAVNPGLSTFGEYNEIFIDKGSADGVEEGNTFAVVRKGDGLSNQLVTKSMAEGEGGKLASKEKTPDENVGLLLVVATKDHLSTAIVIKSVRELQAGDVVEMRASGAGGP